MLMKAKHKCLLSPKKDLVNAMMRKLIHCKNAAVKALRTSRLRTKTGDVVAVEVVHNDDEVMLISEQGKIIRFNMNDIAVKKGKAISGVKTQNLDEGDKVASIAVIPGAEIEDEVAE